ncbi:hypothetical protein C8R45DRAFT_1128523 [Mycena sanguinolenta]|nr:hypothetical protein C8R45DRAFT_1128523 [Mycena sanguinolenta]
MDSSSNAPPPPIKPIRSYTRRKPVDPNPSIPLPPTQHTSYRIQRSLWPPAAPILPAPDPDFSHEQPRLRTSRRTEEEKLADKFEAMDDFLRNSPFDSVGDFLAILFYNRLHGESDPRGITHASAVARFLRGLTDIKMSHILPLIYRHRCSFPAKDSKRVHERELMFSTKVEADAIHHARPSMSTWALKLVAAEARKQVGRATQDDPQDPESHVQLRASTNGRGKAAVHVVTWRDFKNFSVKALAEKYSTKLSVPMFLTKYMAAPMVKRVFIERKRRPHTMIQVAAISSFIVCQNSYANGDMAMLLGIWHFVCKSHVDVKRVYCRFGNTVADTTARTALKSMTAADLKLMRAETEDANSRGETVHCLLLDNVQEYDKLYEQGLGRQSRMKVGTAGTRVKLQRCAPGAFDARDYYARVARKERQTMTVQSLFDDIDWDHEHLVKRLHWARVLVDFVPQLSSLRKEIMAMFRASPIAKRRMPKDYPATEFQPLMLNSEQETSAQGMLRAVTDFDQQIGVDVEKNPHSLSWIRGDGASYAQILRLTRYTATIGNFKNKITTPEIWHTGATDLNSIAENHYGPATCSDPSCLSKASSCAGLKRPSNIKSCDYYPTVRNFTLIWTAHVLDCWRVFYQTDDLLKYFAELEKTDRIPNLETILDDATTLVNRYASQAALQSSLRASEATSVDNLNQVPIGSPWVPRGGSGSIAVDSEMTDVAEPTSTVPVAKESAPSVHQERPGFSGDRVEMSWAVPEGDIGRVWEIMKIWIFKFAGSSHQNYMKYLLEVYCLLRYESSKGLGDAILDNWLVRVKKELGKYLPGDLHQVHYNKWLQDMSRRHGGEFDDPFFRQTISPNVEHFLRFKEEIETAFNLQRRSKTHTSPHQRSELHLLLALFKEEEVHLFRAGRSMGHAAVNQFSRGCRQLDKGKMADFISSTTCLGDFLSAMHRRTQLTPNAEVPDMPPNTSPTESRVSSPTPSSSSSSGSSTSSNASISSLDSVLSCPDPDEPEDDGVDMSDVPRSSGSFGTMYVDENGALQHDDEGELEDEYLVEEGEPQEALDQEDSENEEEEDEFEPSSSDVDYAEDEL